MGTSSLTTFLKIDSCILFFEKFKIKGTKFKPHPAIVVCVAQRAMNGKRFFKKTEDNRRGHEFVKPGNISLKN